jgi:hypothetical protein
MSLLAQISDQTGFILQGDSPGETEVDTHTSWEAEQGLGQGFLPTSGTETHTSSPSSS